MSLPPKSQTSGDAPVETINNHDGNFIAADQSSLPGDMNAQGGQKSVLVIPGFDFWSAHEPGKDMYPFIDTLRYRLNPKGVPVYFAPYNSHKSFVVGTGEVEPCIDAYNIDEKHLYIFGYSMGGLIARQMVMNGLRPHHITTFCTPHHGLIAGLHNQFPNQGVWSMGATSQDLKALNYSTKERSRRGRIAALAMTHMSSGEDHGHDGMVRVESAMGNGLHFGTRRTYLSGRSQWLNPADSPHAKAQTLPDIADVMDGFIRTVLHH